MLNFESQQRKEEPHLPTGSRLTKEQIIDNFELTFDPGDKRNGSLYVGVPRGEEMPLEVSSLLKEMIEAAIWSSDPVKAVPDEHRAAYKDQLELKEVIEYSNGESHFLLARFDHPKFPSDDSRWEDWKRMAASRFEKV